MQSVARRIFSPPFCLFTTVIRLTLLLPLAVGLAACSDFQARMSGYPTQDTALNVETASSNEIADALSQLSRIAVLGDDWEFFDPQDPCTVHVIDKSAGQNIALQLIGAEFDLKRDAHTKNYYATMKHGATTVLGPDQAPLRLFETDTYHDVFFAEGYLQALVNKCQQSLARAAHPYH